MADVKISDMTEDNSISGSEVIPASDAGVAKKIPVTTIKNYVVDSIEAIAAASSVDPADFVYVLIGGVLKPVPLSAIIQETVDDIWGNASGTIADATKIAAKIGATEAAVTAADLATFVQSKLTTAIHNISGLDSATLAGTDFFLVTQGTTPKKTTLAAVIAAIYAGLAAHVVAATAAGSTDKDDVLYAVRGSTPMKMTLAQIAAYVGGGVDGSGTADMLAQWTDSDTLKAGPAVVKSTDGDSDSDEAIPTTAFVMGCLESIVEQSSSIESVVADTFTILAHDAVSAQGTITALRVWTYIVGKIQALDAKTTPVDADILTIQDSAASSALKELTVGNLWDNRYLADAKAVKLDDFAAPDDNADLDATASKHGLMPKADKVKLDLIVQQATVADPAACAAMTATLTGVDTGTDMTSAQAATITADLAALKSAVDANRSAIMDILSRLETLGLFAAS